MNTKSTKTIKRWLVPGMLLVGLGLAWLLPQSGPEIQAQETLETHGPPWSGQSRTTRPVSLAIKPIPLAQSAPPPDIVYITTLPEFPIMDLQTEAEFTLGMQNIGPETWRAGDYSLVNIGDQSFSPWPQLAMDIDVPPGHHLEWRVPLKAPDRSGIYRTAWQLSYRGELAGPVVWVDLIVIPGGSTAAFRATIQALLDQLLQSAGEKIARGRAKIREVITEVVGARVRPVFINPLE